MRGQSSGPGWGKIILLSTLPKPAVVIPTSYPMGKGAISPRVKWPVSEVNY
jgi:hypothetical protein